MVTGFLGHLAGAALRNAAQNLFSGFYERGLSANQALNILRDQGLGYRRQDFLNDYRQGEARYTGATRIRFVAGGNVPSENILEPGYFGTPDKFSLVFKATGKDRVSGETKEQYFFQHRNSLSDRRTMERDAQDWMDEEAATYGLAVEDISIVEGYINEAWA